MISLPFPPHSSGVQNLMDNFLIKPKYPNAEFYFVSDTDSSVNRENLPGKKRSTDYLIR